MSTPVDDDRDGPRRGHRRPSPIAARTRTGRSGLRLIVRTDGAARGNPGPASAGAVLIDADAPGARDPLAPPLATISDYLGVQTNNVAEYTAVVRALGLAAELGAREVHLLLDSKLIVEQVHGRWRVKDAKLQPLHAEVRRRGSAGFARWTAVHVPRAQNTAADAMCNEAIDRALAGGPASVVRRPGRPRPHDRPAASGAARPAAGRSGPSRPRSIIGSRLAALGDHRRPLGARCARGGRLGGSSASRSRSGWRLRSSRPRRRAVARPGH